MKICHLISGDLWAGAEVQAFSLLRSLKELPEVEISAIVLNHGRLATELTNAGISVEVIDEGKFGFREILAKASSLLKDRQLQILHSHRYKENILAAQLKRRCGIGHLVQTVHGSPEQTIGLKGFKARLFSLLNDHYSRKFDRIVSVSYDLSRRLEERYPKHLITTIHNAVDVKRIAPTRSRNEIRAELGIGPDQPVVGIVGRLVAVKGIDRFLQLAPIVLKKRPDSLFLIVGDGPLFDEYKQRVQSLNLGESVRMIGFRPDVIDVINCLDIYVMTSHHEGIPMTLLEAFALKRPVVAMSVGGIPEVVEDGVSGILIESGDVEAMSAACLKLLSEPERSRQLGENAKHRLESEFAIEVHRKRVLEMYRTVISHRQTT